MNAVIISVTRRLERLHPGLVFLLGVLFLMVVYGIDFFTPSPMSVAVFYLLGTAFVGWGAGRWWAGPISLLAALMLSQSDWVRLRTRPQEIGFVFWNITSRFFVLWSAGWLAAEWSRLTRTLGSLVAERTEQWKVESERHQATSARLAETLARFQEVTNNIAEVFWLSDVATAKIIYVSPGYERVWGRSCDEPCQHPQAWLKAVHPEDHEKVAPHRGSSHPGDNYDLEYRIVRPDGEVRWIHDRAFPVRDASGKVYRLAGIAEDITERKRSELLQAIQRDVGLSLSLTSDLSAGLKRLLGILMQLEGVDCGGVHLFDDATGALQLVAHEGLSEPFAKAVALLPADRLLPQLVRQGQPLIVPFHEAPFQADVAGRLEGLRGVALLPLTHNGLVIGSLSIASRHVDQFPPQTRWVLEVISAQVAGAIARIRAESALKESELRLRTIINSAPLILFAGNRDGTLSFKEGQGLKAVGLQPGVPSGTPAAQAFASYPQILQHLPKVLAGEEFSAIVQLGLYAFACRYSPVRDPDGAVVGFIGVATNITEQQRLERQILEISDREQARIGQDIHDGLCQQLVSVAFDANSLERQLATAQRPERGLAERIASYMDKAITEARQLSRGLFPIRLEGDGLALALEELAQTTRERFGVQCTLTSDKRAREKDPVVATHLYRIAQEAINNALKHGHARLIQIRLSWSEAGLELAVEDDGNGLNPDAVGQSHGMGLHIMEYRARSIGARFAVGPGSRGGTLVSCCVLTSLP